MKEPLLCCVLKRYVGCGECEEQWCEMCFLREYYTRSHTHEDVQDTFGSWMRVFDCPNTKKKIMLATIDGRGDTFTEAAYKENMYGK